MIAGVLGRSMLRDNGHSPVDGFISVTAADDSAPDSESDRTLLYTAGSDLNPFKVRSTKGGLPASGHTRSGCFLQRPL
jgi:hypothetical protein